MDNIGLTMPDLTAAELAALERRLCHFACHPREVQVDARRLVDACRALQAENERLRAALRLAGSGRHASPLRDDFPRIMKEGAD